MFRKIKEKFAVWRVRIKSRIYRKIILIMNCKCDSVRIDHHEETEYSAEPMDGSTAFDTHLTVNHISYTFTFNRDIGLSYSITINELMLTRHFINTVGNMDSVTLSVYGLFKDEITIVMHEFIPWIKKTNRAASKKSWQDTSVQHEIISLK